MNICIDFGNTSIKAAVFEGSVLKQYLAPLNQVELLDLVNSHLDAKLALASVSEEVTHIVNLIEQKDRMLRLTHLTKVPILNRYETPETLGMDRLAAVVGASYLYPNQTCLVVDAGTCITYDLIEANQQYIGGSISPGIEMRYRSLHAFTSKLPLITKPDFDQLVGKNTHQSLVSGVQNGIIGEVNWIMSQYKMLYPELLTVFCGGNTDFFESTIKEPIFAVPELVLIGLNRVLTHNAST